jgi:hypothetical protein
MATEKQSTHSQSAQSQPAQSSDQNSGNQTQKSGSANPDHQGGKVESGQTKKDGSVAATEEEKGGSSE